MPANAGQSAVDGQGSSLQNRFRADAGRTINTKKSIARLLVQARDRLNRPSISTPQPAKAITASVTDTTSRPHYSQHLVECGHQGGAKRRGGQYWILCSCLSSQGKSAPLLKSGGPLAPTHRASLCSPHEVSPDPTPRGHHHGPALATRPRPCDVPRPGNSGPSGTSHSAIRIQISTNCPNIACHANLTAAANQRLGLALCPANAQHSTAVGCLTLDGGNLGSRATAIHLIPPQRRTTGCQVTCIPV